MADAPPRWRRILEYVLSIGSYPGEAVTQRGGRRVAIVAIVVATLLTIPTAFAALSAGYGWDAAMTFFLIAAAPLVLVAIRLKPHRFAWIVNALFVLVFTITLVETALFGGYCLRDWPWCSG